VRLVEVNKAMEAATNTAKTDPENYPPISTGFMCFANYCIFGRCTMQRPPRSKVEQALIQARRDRPLTRRIRFLSSAICLQTNVDELTGKIKASAAYNP